ncbi:S-adenosyl-L-methionine-dependent methyltransferase [Boletus edulis]|nr:S-adenosyl-L-methionine-dependent methyltransferase [Boletus edulis]
MSTVDFDPSLLGTKDHWDQRYSEELAHFYESGLEGEAWYVPTLAYISLSFFPHAPCPNVLDVGTGNGHCSFAMVDAGYDASRLTGIDYSRGSVDLSIAIAKQRDVQDEGNADVDEVRTETTTTASGTSVLDKGTFDAMSLMDEDERGTVSLERYVPRVVRLLRSGGHFLITCEALSLFPDHLVVCDAQAFTVLIACNFTKDELIQRIATRGSGLEYKGSIPYKTFTFGGKSGSSYATVAFQKQSVSIG